jgi:hypothetical protein
MTLDVKNQLSDGIKQLNKLKKLIIYHNTNLITNDLLQNNNIIKYKFMGKIELLFNRLIPTILQNFKISYKNNYTTTLRKIEKSNPIIIH